MVFLMMGLMLSVADPVPSSTLTLAQALELAYANQPTLKQAKANVQAADAQADIARAPLLPQINATFNYTRTTANFTPRPGSVPAQFTQTASPSFKSYDFFNANVSVNQLVYDFGTSTGRWQARKATRQATEAQARQTKFEVELAVRLAYFNARASRAMVEVAKEIFANQERHFKQVTGFVTAGTRPAIDLSRQRTDLANARVRLITAENNYNIARAQLNQAMGIEAEPTYDVGDEQIAAVPSEDDEIGVMLDEAQNQRPEFAFLNHSIRAQELSLRALKGNYAPALGVSTAGSEAGTRLHQMVWNWNANVNLTWPIFEGGLTLAQRNEAQAILLRLQAELEVVRQRVRLEIDQARLAVRAGRETITAANEATASAREQLRFAESRYQTGVGNIIELGDAEVALAETLAASVNADYQLAISRAQLLRALGR